METILEQQRRYHEERERLIKLMVDEYATKKPSVSAQTHLYLCITIGPMFIDDEPDNFYCRNESAYFQSIV